MRNKYFDAISSSGVTLSNSQFCSVCSLSRRPTLFRFPCYTEVGLAMELIFFGYKRKSESGIQLVDIHLVWVVISYCFSPNAKMNMSLTFTSRSSRNSGNISLSVVILFRSISWVILTYCINLLHHSFAS